MSRAGFRVFIDPTRFPDPPDEAIYKVAEAMGVGPEVVGERVIERLAANDARVAAHGPVEQEPERDPIEELRALVTGKKREQAVEPAREGPKLIRYAPIDVVIDRDRAELVQSLRIAGVYVEERAVREYPAGAIASGVVGKVGVEHEGLLGAEYALDRRLVAESRQIEYARDAWGRALWMGAGRWEGQDKGEPVRLSVDLEIQRIATEELGRQLEDKDAAGGRCVVMDPRTGELLAMVDLIREIEDAVEFPWDDKEAVERVKWPPAERVRYRALTADPGREIHPALGRNRNVEDVYEPGSTFKPFVWAAVTERGRARPEEKFDTEGGHWRTSYGRYVEDVTKRTEMTWGEVLVHSSNIGMVKGSERLTPEELHGAILRYGFGRRTGVALPGEAVGLVTSLKDWSKYTHTSVSFGYEVAVTPVQMTRAFSAFCREGELAGTLPPVRLESVEEGEQKLDVVERVTDGWVALTARHLMGDVALKMEALMARSGESGWRYRMFGKSGTANIALGGAPEGKRLPRGSRGYLEHQYRSSFVAGGPIESPRLVVLVVVDDPGPEFVRRREHYGSWIAGPAVRRIMERSLSYLGEPPSPPASGEGIARAGSGQIGRGEQF